jgi:hypothetical protein
VQAAPEIQILNQYLRIKGNEFKKEKKYQTASAYVDQSASYQRRILLRRQHCTEK